MKAYHGTNREIEKLDVSHTAEYGLYFTTDRDVAADYGQNVHEVELNFNNLIDLSGEAGIKKALEIYPLLAQAIIEDQDLDEELTVAELIEDEFEACLSALSDSSINLENGDCLRDELMKSLNKARYDAVKIEDYTDGNYHDAYVIFDNSNIK